MSLLLSLSSFSSPTAGLCPLVLWWFLSDSCSLNQGWSWTSGSIWMEPHLRVRFYWGQNSWWENSILLLYCFLCIYILIFITCPWSFIFFLDFFHYVSLSQSLTISLWAFIAVCIFTVSRLSGCLCILHSIWPFSFVYEAFGQFFNSVLVLPILIFTIRTITNPNEFE